MSEQAQKFIRRLSNLMVRINDGDKVSGHIEMYLEEIEDDFRPEKKFVYIKSTEYLDTWVTSYEGTRVIVGMLQGRMFLSY